MRKLGLILVLVTLAGCGLFQPEAVRNSRPVEEAPECPAMTDEEALLRGGLPLEQAIVGRWWHISNVDSEGWFEFTADGRYITWSIAGPQDSDIWREERLVGPFEHTYRITGPLRVTIDETHSLEFARRDGHLVPVWTDNHQRCGPILGFPE